MVSAWYQGNAELNKTIKGPLISPNKVATRHRKWYGVGGGREGGGSSTVQVVAASERSK